MKVDPYRSKEVFLRWRQETAGGIPGLSRENSRLVHWFLSDMECGRNVARGSRKGPRSYIRLCHLRQKLLFVVRKLAERGVGVVSEAREGDVHGLFAAMRSGEISRRNGGAYRSTGDYVKDFRAFWHWYMKVQRKRGVVVADICVDLDGSCAKPPWTYLTMAQVRLLCDHAKFEYRVLLWFLFDSGIRSPTELVNVRRCDLSPECTELRIRAESSKTFGRTIKLMHCAELLVRHIRERDVRESEQVFPIRASVVNRYLQRLARRVLGEGISPGGKRYCALTLYDFRHSAACYWLQKYKSEAALKYRFGWKKSRMIYYYTDLIGMCDTITDDDLVSGEKRAAVERELSCARRDKAVLQERLRAMEAEMKRVLVKVEQLFRKIA